SAFKMSYRRSIRRRRAEVFYEYAANFIVDMYCEYFGANRKRWPAKKKAKTRTESVQRACQLKWFRSTAARSSATFVRPERLRDRPDQLQRNRRPATSRAHHERRVLRRMSFAAGDWRGRIVHQRDSGAQQHPAGSGAYFCGRQFPAQWTTDAGQHGDFSERYPG